MKTEIESVAIEIIVIRVDGVRFELTPAQARELYEVLGRLFNDNHTVYAPMIVPMPVPSYPFVPSVTWHSMPGNVSNEYTWVSRAEGTNGD